MKIFVSMGNCLQIAISLKINIATERQIDYAIPSYFAKRGPEFSLSSINSALRQTQYTHFQGQ